MHFKCLSQSYSLKTFHKSSIPFKTIMSLMGSFILLFVIFYFVFREITGFYKIKRTATLNLISFLVLELLPMVLLCGVMGVKYHSKYVTGFKEFLVHIWLWFKTFCLDIVHHFWIIMTCVLICIVLQNFTNVVLPHLLGQSISYSQNTHTIDQMGRSNKLFLLSTVVIAPIAEEFFFRLCCTTAFQHFVDLFGRIYLYFYHLAAGERIKFFKAHLNKYFVKFCYIVGALLSALIFSLLHDPMDPSISLLVGYMVMALTFQYIMHTSHSLTASVIVHGMLNLIVIVPAVFL